MAAKQGKIRIVMAFGTFDVLHKGHISYLEQAKKLGDKLIVVVSRDETVRRIKKKNTMFNQDERVAYVQIVPCVDKAILGKDYLKDRLKVVEDVKPDIICLGYDQEIDERKLQEELKEKGISAKIVRLKAYMPDVYKTSRILKNIREKPEKLPISV